MQTLCFEFIVTRKIDWSDKHTIYVKAFSSRDAIRYMDGITDSKDDEKEFADFRYLCYIPDSSLWNSVPIYDATADNSVVVEFTQNSDPNIPFLDWWVARYNGRVIATIGRNKYCESDYSITTYDTFFDVERNCAIVNYDFTHQNKTLEEAKQKAYDFALYLNEKSNERH